MYKDKIKYEDEWIINIHEKIVRDKKLSIQAKGLYAILKSFCDKEMKAFPSMQYLSDLACISRGSVAKYLKELEQKKYLEIEKIRKDDGTYSHNVYKLYANGKQNNHVQNLNMDKQAKNPSPFYQHGKLNTSINPLYSILISMAHSLIKNLEANKDGYSIELLKVVNRFKGLLGEDSLREKLSYLFWKNKQFNTISDLAAYLQAIINNTQKPEISNATWYQVN